MYWKFQFQTLGIEGATDHWHRFRGWEKCSFFYISMTSAVKNSNPVAEPPNVSILGRKPIGFHFGECPMFQKYWWQANEMAPFELIIVGT
jgi:hypothetical protein